MSVNWDVAAIVMGLREVPGRDNFDVMNIEHNVFDNIFNTMMDVPRKTKNNIKCEVESQQTHHSIIGLKNISCYNDYNGDIFELLVNIVELEYFGVNKQVVLFKCHWFDIDKGLQVYLVHGLVKIRHNSILASNEPFVLIEQVTQLYYTSSPSKRRDQCDWWAMLKMKARSRFPITDNEQSDGKTIDLNKRVY
ncbi:Uncharacterized protein TCM_039361 [Theobroma cacao]|uniref:DUF4216 domain-containing protein n=1 Tax=Theobroma cacao TaxID=3641 RepID=A0A061GR39_THECC|nr:Uncharacterized protein TCM_039361 [Theobroma cacao]